MVAVNRRILLLLAAVVLAGVSFASVRSARPAGVLHAVERAAPERMFPAQFSTDTEYRPCAPVDLPADSIVPREACGAPEDLPLELAGLSQAGELSLDPDTLRASALAAVFWWDGKEASLDDAITRLTKALRLGGDSAAVLVDLSAVHLARAQSPQNAMDLWVGLEHALHALEIEPKNQAALFNVAFALHAVALDNEARKAWDAYLATDSTSDWAAEARHRRAALDARDALPDPTVSSSREEITAFAARHPQEARELGWDVVLGAWGTAVLDGRAAGADSLLRLAEGLGAALTDQGGDESLADAVDAIHAAQGDTSALRTLADAHRLYAAGRHALSRGDSLAGQVLARVLALEPRSVTLVAWASAFRAASLKDSAAVEALIATTDSAGYSALAARVRAMRGTMHSWNPTRNQDAELFASAARLAGAAGESETYGNSRRGEGWAAHRQGDTIAAYDFIHRALLALRDIPESKTRHNLLLEAGELTAKDGLSRAALRIHNEDVAGTTGAMNPGLTVEALLARAPMRAATGWTGGAVADVVAATAREAELPTDWREHVRHARSVSHALSGSSGAASLRGLDSAIAYFQDHRETWLLPALMRRADLQIARGDLGGAHADLARVTARIHRNSQSERAAYVRAAILDQARTRFNQLVMLQVRARQPIRALKAVERGRVSFASGGDTAAASARLTSPPPEQVVIEYALIGDTLLTWIVRRDSVTLHEQRIDANALRFTVEQAGAALEAGRDEAAAPHLHRLHALLIRPVKARLAASDPVLVILADGEVAGVPFAALSEGPGALLLIQTHSIRFAATLTDAVRPVERTAAKSALLIADPAFDEAEHPELYRLNGAEAEVKSLRPLYADARVLQDSGATVDAFAELAPAADIIHYAGHAVFDDMRPERSYLVLAGAGEDGRLRAASVGALELSDVRMVVLSACRTLRARQGRSGGFAGLSGAMLSAGADGVAGSLWEVDDDLTQPLMLAFHREYRDTRDPAAALRQAQLRMLNSDDPRESAVSAWAGFRYVGR